MYIPPAYDPKDRLRGLQRELAADVSRVVEDLEFRREFLREIWSVSRDRGAFLDTVTTRWRTLDATDLLHFESAHVALIDGFYHALEDFTLYLRFTDDMPTTLGERYDRTLERLKAIGDQVLAVLGGAPPRAFVEFDHGQVTVHQHVRGLFAAPRRPPVPDAESEEESDEWARATQAELARLYRDDPE